MRVFNRLALLAGTAILSALIGGHLNALHPAFDSLSHFRLHLAVAGVALALLLAVMRHALGAAALGVISALSLALTVWPALEFGNEKPAAETGASYRLIQANLRFDNRTPEEFLRLLAREQPDVVTLQEVSESWLPKLAAISASWPHRLICPGTNRVGGVAILSRRPFAPGGLSACAHSGALGIATIDFNGANLTIATVHLKWPWPHGQPRQLAAMAADFRAMKDAGFPFLMGGDMNAAPWSAAVQSIADATGSKVLPQVRGTWLLANMPASWIGFAGLPIDNILASEQVRLTDAARTSPFGSDHLAIVVDFTVDREALPANPDGDTPTG